MNLPRNNGVYRELALVGLAVVSVFLLVFEITSELSAGTIQLLHSLDLAISLIFLCDFAYGYYKAESKSSYMKSDWYLLVAAIPLPEFALRSLRSVRLIRLIRVVRVVARLKRMTDLAAKQEKGGEQFIQLVIYTVVVVFTAAVAFFSAEASANPNVATLFDAFWWSTVTSTTVGYGDISPVTVEGRLIAMALMLYGIGLVGSVAGLIGARFVGSNQVEA